MAKRAKTLMWVLATSLLIIGNVVMVRHYMHKVDRVAYAANILDEIELLDSVDLTGEVLAAQTEIKESSDEAKIATPDARIANLKRFFRKYNSALYEHADFIVEQADANQLDYRLLPAIAMQESGVCRTIPHNSHNCWGWGIYGTKVTRFDSYPHAIETISKGLKKNYIDQGLTTPSQIMAKYTPSSNGSWAFGVNTFLGILE